MIDNFEHVADAALVLTDLLMANPELTIMVTSRSVLSVYGEHVYPVPPMSVPVVRVNNAQATCGGEATPAPSCSLPGLALA